MMQNGLLLWRLPETWQCAMDCQTLGMRLLARAALDEDKVIEAEFVLQEAFVRSTSGNARAMLDRVEYANAWAAGQMLTLSEARSWLVVLHRLIGN